MFTEILKIKPQLDSGALTSMEQSLSGRFQSVAKRFGSGLKTALLVGDTVDTLKGLLDRGSGLVDKAKEFNTTEGKLLALQTIGQSKGVDNEATNQLLAKFQVALSEARLKQNQPGAELSPAAAVVKNFTGFTDTIDAFTAFQKSLRQSKQDVQTFAESTLYGERQVGRSSALLNADLEARAKEIGIPSEALLTDRVKRAGNLGEQNSLLGARRSLNDFTTNTGTANSDFITAFNQAEDQRALKQQQDFKEFLNRQTAATKIDELKDLVDTWFNKIFKLVPHITSALDSIDLFIKNISKSRLLKGFFGN